MKNYFLLFICLCTSVLSFSQNKIDINAVFNTAKHSIAISQELTYTNTSNKVLDTIYLNDWSHSYSSKTTPLAERFADEFKTTFHFAKNEDRGFTAITSINQNNTPVFFERLDKKHPDVIKVALNQPLKPNNSYTLQLKYIVTVLRLGGEPLWVLFIAI